MLYNKEIGDLLPNLSILLFYTIHASFFGKIVDESESVFRSV